MNAFILKDAKYGRLALHAVFPSCVIDDEYGHFN